MSEVSKNIADLVTIQTFLDQATAALEVPAYVREAMTRLGNRAMANSMQQDIRSMTVDRLAHKVGVK
jgi:hypothetical protein